MDFRMLRDVEYFKSRIGALDEGNDAGDFLVELVKKKYVPNQNQQVEEEKKQDGNNQQPENGDDAPKENGETATTTEVA